MPTPEEELHEVLLIAAAVVCEDPPIPHMVNSVDLRELVKILRRKGYISHSCFKQTK